MVVGNGEAGGLPLSEQEALLAEAWDLAARIDFEAAYERFAELEERGGIPQERIDLGIGVTLLNLPPKSVARIERARSLLQRAWEARFNEHEAALAGYYLARIPQFHTREPDYAAAVQGYEAVVAAYPDTLAGQLSQLRLAGLALIRRDFESAEELNAAVREQAKRLEEVTDPRIRRNMGRLFAEELVSQGGSPELALKFAYLGVRLDPPRADIRRYYRHRVIVLAMETGEYELAREQILAYLDDFPGTRRLMMEERLRQVERALAERSEVAEAEVGL